MALGVQIEKEGIAVSVVAETRPTLLLFLRNEEAPRLCVPFPEDARLGNISLRREDSALRIRTARVSADTTASENHSRKKRRSARRSF